MKKNLTCYMLYVFLFALIILWYFQGRKSNDYLEYLAVLAAIVSALIAIKHFKLTITLNKVHAMTLSPEASAHIVRIIKYLDSVNLKDTKTIVCKKNIETNNELFVSVIFILGFFDDLAIAIKKGIIDEKLTKEIIGSSIKRMTKDFRPYIDEVSDSKKEQLDEVSDPKSKQSYSNLIWLYSRWEK